MRRRLARDLFGLLLAGVGTVGLLGALYSASPPTVVFLIGALTASAGGAVLRQTEPPVPPQVRLYRGYVTLTVGLALMSAAAYTFTPWSVLFGAILAVAVWMSGEGA
jgi:hypothetical protein